MNYSENGKIEEGKGKWYNYILIVNKIIKKKYTYCCA